MANVFEKTDLVARDAAIELKNTMKVAGMLSDSVEQKFAQKVGSTVNVVKRPIATATRHTTGAFPVDDINEVKVPIVLRFRAIVKKVLTAEQMTLSVDDFFVQVTRPSMVAIAEMVDTFFVQDVLVRGFAQNVVGVAGTDPTLFAHLTDAWKVLFANKCPDIGKQGVLTPDAAANMLDLNQFQSRDFGEDRVQALRNALISPVLNSEFFPAQSAGTQALGDVAGTVLVKGAAQTGTSIDVDGFTAATGTVNEGVRLTFAGDSQVYTLTADATISGNAATFVITPSKSGAAADNAAVTFETALKENIVFHPDAVARALITPEPQKTNPSSVATIDNVPMRVTFESSINDAANGGDSESVLYDVFVGGHVIHPECGVILQGV